MSDIQILRPFGPSIVKLSIPDDLVKKLNDYTDRIILDEEKITKLDHSNQLAGKVKQEFLLENEFMQEIKWGEFLAKAIKVWLQDDSNKELKSIDIIRCWIVRQFQNEYNPVHMHGGHVSGAGFLKVPKTFGKYVQNEKDGVKHYAGGTLNLIHGSKQFLSKSTFQIKPEVGDFYFFPHYLMHTVYPFKGTEDERRSISFNANIDSEIYNVYGK